MNTPWYKRVAEGLTRTREELTGQLNVLVGRGPDVDEGFWEELEDALIGADMGVPAVTEITDRLRASAARERLTDSHAVLELLTDEIAEELALASGDVFELSPVTVLVVGVNGTGKTTTIAKLANELQVRGRSVLLGSADTYRAAADEQLQVWAGRVGVPIVSRERGADPAAVAFDAIRRAREEDFDVTLVDTAGRLHTSRELMGELAKISRIVKRESLAPVRTLLVMDATTGQNGITQARQFDQALGVDGIVLTKLDGTAKGGVCVAIARELGLPIVRVGVGEALDDLKPFDPGDFARALTGAA